MNVVDRFVTPQAVPFIVNVLSGVAVAWAPVAFEAFAS